MNWLGSYSGLGWDNDVAPSSLRGQSREPLLESSRSGEGMDMSQKQISM